MEKTKFTSGKILWVLQIAAVAVFLGRAWQHLFWDAPYRALLWDETLMSSLVETLGGISWKEYVTSPAVDRHIQLWIRGTGVFYLICSLTAAFINRAGRAGRIILAIGAFSLVLLSFLYYKEKFFFLGQLLEYTLQWSSPLFLLWYLKKGALTERMSLMMKVAIAFTFTCHGLYAIGYYPRPGNFLEMTMLITGMGNTGAETFLNIAGILDFMLSILIFVPRLAVPALTYAVFWGLSTTLARLWAYLPLGQFPEMLHLWLHESVMRFPHFLIPLAVLMHLLRLSSDLKKQKINK